MSINDKWKTALEGMGITGSKADFLSEYAESHSKDKVSHSIDPILKNEEISDFPNLLFPVVKKVFAKTLAGDLGFASKEEVDKVKNRIQVDNRDGKIDAVLEDKEFVEKKLEDDEEYKKLMKKGVKPMSAPTGQLFYLDYKYGSDEN
jgi:hypothetical protein